MIQSNLFMNVTLFFFCCCYAISNDADDDDGSRFCELYAPAHLNFATYSPHAIHISFASSFL